MNLHNSFGRHFSITSFGESHGVGIGIIIDGCPSGLDIKIDKIQKELDRRRPGQSGISTSRTERDRVEIMSGILNGKSTGAPICMFIKNTNVDSTKYEQFRTKPRPSHADYPAMMKYGKSVDLRGGGRFSGRITAGFVMAGAIAKMLLELVNIKVAAYTRSVSNIRDDTEYSETEITDSIENNSVRTVNSEIAKKMEQRILEVKELKDSVGGIVTCLVEGVPPGVGEPIFGSLESILSSAIFSIPGVRGIEFGLGFKATEITGSQHNDPYSIEDGKISTTSNNSGGIVGGISTGMPIKFNVAIKPTASIGIEQNTVNLDSGKPDKLKIEGRHDPCIVPRAVPVVEAITSVTLVDFLIGSGIISKTL